MHLDLVARALCESNGRQVTNYKFAALVAIVCNFGSESSMKLALVQRA